MAVHDEQGLQQQQLEPQQRSQPPTRQKRSDLDDERRSRTTSTRARSRSHHRRRRSRSHDRHELRIRTPPRATSKAAGVVLAPTSVVPAQGLVSLPAATLHAVVACLEQSSMALGHAQSLCLEASRAFAEEQTNVRSAMASIRDALRNGGYSM